MYSCCTVFGIARSVGLEEIVKVRDIERRRLMITKKGESSHYKMMTSEYECIYWRGLDLGLDGPKWSRVQKRKTRATSIRTRNQIKVWILLATTGVIDL